jgi:hypothetical protein
VFGEFESRHLRAMKIEQGLKPALFFAPFSARLKPRPDTKLCSLGAA